MSFTFGELTRSRAARQVQEDHELGPSGHARGGEAPFAFSAVNLLAVALLNGRAGRFASPQTWRFPTRAVKAKIRVMGRLNAAATSRSLLGA